MDSPTSNSPAAPVAAPAAATPARHSEARGDKAQAEALMSLWDKGAFESSSAARAEKQKEQRQESRKTSEAPSKDEPETQDTLNESPTDDSQESEEGASEVSHGDEGPLDWEDLDDYFTKQQIDRAKAKVKVKVDGKEQQVALAEALKSYELAQAGHARLAEAAKAREQFQLQQQQAIEAFQMRGRVLETLGGEVQQYFLAPYEQAVAQAAQAGDRGAYAAACYDRDAAKQWFTHRLQGIAQEQLQHAQLAQQTRLQALPQERQRMLAARPEWNEQSRFDTDSRLMREHGAKLGFSDAELGSITDHRHLLVLDGAAKMAAAQQAASAALGKNVTMDDIVSMVGQMAQLQASKPEVTQRVAQAPQMSKPGTRSAPKDPKAAERSRLKQSAKKSHYSDASAAALLENLFS